MNTPTNKNLLLAVLLLGIRCNAFAASVMSTRLDDSKAVYLTAPEFGVHGDGKTDDSAAIQAAVDKAENRVREGIVFVPPLPAYAYRLCMARRARLSAMVQRGPSSC